MDLSSRHLLSHYSLLPCLFLFVSCSYKRGRRRGWSMSDHMDLCWTGQSRVPPGFRFHPTEEELLNHYLRNKVAAREIDLDIIQEIDLNKLEPWDIQEVCKIGSAPQSDCYLFSHKDKKYPTGTRTNRATAAGFWKATGRDKAIHGDGRRRIGMRKTLVFYRGRAPHGEKTDWIMHEYRLDDDSSTPPTNHVSLYSIRDSCGAEEGWVVCRIFKKKNLPKPSSSLSEYPLNSSTSGDNTILNQIITYMGRTEFKPETESNQAPAEISYQGQLPGLVTASHDVLMEIPDDPTGQTRISSCDWGEDSSYSFGDTDEVPPLMSSLHGEDQQIVTSLDADFWNLALSSLLSPSDQLPV